MAPIGNTIQNQGMMNGYYNPYPQQMGYGYGGNPYLIRKQQEMEAAKRREEERGRADLWKTISRNVHNASNSNISDIEEHVKKYDPVDQYNEEYVHETQYVRLVQICQTGTVVSEAPNPRIDAVNSQIQKTKTKYADDMDIFDFFDKAGEIIVEDRIAQQREQQRDLTKLYDSTKYKELVNKHSKKGGGIFSSLFDSNRAHTDNLDIDDMEITLPSQFKDEYSKKRDDFLRAIMDG